MFYKPLLGSQGMKFMPVMCLLQDVNIYPFEIMKHHTSAFSVSLDNLTPVPVTTEPVCMRSQVRANKTKSLVDEVEMLQANPHYAHVRYPDGRETTVGTEHLAPQGQTKLLLPLDML